MRLGSVTALSSVDGDHGGLVMLIALRLIKWALVLVLIFVGIVLLLPNFGIDIAQAVQGHMGGRWIIAAVVFIDSALGRLVLSSYTLAIGALLVVIASFLVFYRV
jgi:hypothetical protein